MIDIRLVTAVNEMDKGMSPPAILESTLLVTPPGQSARIMSPTENSGESPAKWTIISAMSGKIIT